MDILRSNTFSISNPTPWLSIWVIYSYLVVEKHTYQWSNSPTFEQTSCIWEYIYSSKQLSLLHLCTQSNLSQITPYKILFVSCQSCFVIIDALPSQPSIARATRCLFSRLQRALNALFFVSQFHPLHPSSYALHKIDLCLLKREICE